MLVAVILGNFYIRRDRRSLRVRAIYDGARHSKAANMTNEFYAVVEMLAVAAFVVVRKAQAKHTRLPSVLFWTEHKIT
jgi:hypothetical protein